MVQQRNTTQWESAAKQGLVGQRNGTDSQRKAKAMPGVAAERIGDARRGYEKW